MQHFKVLKMDATGYSESLYLSTNVYGVASMKDILMAGNQFKLFIQMGMLFVRSAV
jgi:hypothetical protein